MKRNHPPYLKLAALVIGLGLPMAAKLARADYAATVLADGPLAYYRLNDQPPVDVATNRGSLGATGNGTYRHDNAAQTTQHRVTGALVGNGNAAASFQSGNGAPVLIPYHAALNPSGAFTVEAWVNPTVATDDNAGPCPLFNRKSSGARQGWVFFQRSPTTGWNFRTYGNGVDSSTTVNITGGSYTVGQWVHLAATYDGVTARLYVNGTQAASGNPTAYQANSVAALSVGAYSDLSGSGPAYQNPFIGNADEVALYSTALSAAKILAHYQNGTNTARTSPYETLVATDGAVEYLRLDETDPTIDTAVNLGSIGADADGLHFPGLSHQVSGALAGDSDTAASYSAIDSSSTDGGVPTIIPYNPVLNPGGAFSVEAWVKPTIEGAGNAQCPLYNRITTSPRSGWVFFQRDHTTGWNLRMYNGVDTSRSIDITGGPYTIGVWTHLVAVHTGSAATLYVNGVSVGTQSLTGPYAANGSGPFAIGGFPLYSNGSFENPFTGPIDEVAIYTNTLSSAQVLAHYQNGTNAARTTPYSSLVLSNGAVGYWRLDEPAKDVALNLGTLGSAANGTYASVTNPINNLQQIVYFSNPNKVAGPQGPTYAGFEATNQAAYFDGLTNYIELLNPAGLNFSGQVTVEAWVSPDAAQNFDADMVAHGGNDTFSAEDALRIEGSEYQILSYDGSNHKAAASIPGGDLGGGVWVHIAGTYDGANWNIYRNGVLVGTAADATGQLPVVNANWAVGARGRWKYSAGLERLFTGAIDEPAIYNYALSQSHLAAHYSIGVYGTNPLTITRSGTNVILTWPGGTLQEADSVSGPYTDLPSATSGYSVPATGMKFYRVKF